MGKLSERILFGQFLIKKGLITYSMLNKAVKLQESECIDMKLGEILHKQFGVFKSTEELNKLVDEFYKQRNNTLDERRFENEKRSISAMIDDVGFYLSQYAQTLDIKMLQRAIIILQGEEEFKLSQQDNKEG